MARGTPPGEQPYYVQNKDRKIEQLKKDRNSLQGILDLLFDTERDWLKVTTDELVELRKRIKRGSNDDLES